MDAITLSKSFMANDLSLAEPRQTLYMHIGTHKTGTTAIQKFLYDNKGILESKGVNLILTGMLSDNTESWGNHELARVLPYGDKNFMWRMAADEAIGSSAALISSEEFSLIRNASLYEPLKTHFASTTLVRPICYLRRQDQYLESVYNHHVKSLGEVQPIMDFAKRIAYRLNYFEMVQCLVESFGQKNVILRTYDQKFINGDIFQDFLKAIGIGSTADFIFPKAPINLGLSADGLAKMLEANRRYAKDHDKLKTARIEIIEAYSAPSFTEHKILTQSERDCVLGTYTEKNNSLAKTFLGRNSMF